MGKRALTRELYDAMVAGFREAPGNASHAARVSGCDRRMAARGWTEGWCRQWAWARPISAVLAEERHAAKQKAAEAERAAEAAAAERAERARQKAIEAQAEEEQVLYVGRKDVLGVLVAAAELQPAMRKLARKVTEAIDRDKDISLREAMTVLTRYAQVTQRAVMAADLMLKLSRLDRGEVTERVAGVVEAEYTPEEAAAEIANANEALARAQARGLVLPGPGEADEGAPAGQPTH